jgi:hypothetical protein
VDPDGMVKSLLRRGAEGMLKQLVDMLDVMEGVNMGIGVMLHH